MKIGSSKCGPTNEKKPTRLYGLTDFHLASTNGSYIYMHFKDWFWSMRAILTSILSNGAQYAFYWQTYNNKMPMPNGKKLFFIFIKCIQYFIWVVQSGKRTLNDASTVLKTKSSVLIGKDNKQEKNNVRVIECSMCMQMHLHISKE